MIHVLKVGGSAGVDHEAVLRNLAARLAAGEQWILVHGGSAAADQLAGQVGYPAQRLQLPNGHSSRYTDARTLEIFSAAAATVNQQLVAGLARCGANAVGLAGPNIIRAERKTAIRAIRDGRQVVVRDDYSGTITGSNVKLLRTLLDTGFTPVVAPLAMGTEYERLNIDGDLAAAQIARDLQAHTLVILSNVPGLLRDVSHPDSLIRAFTLAALPEYEGFAAGRMKKKLMAAQAAQAARVIIADSRLENPLDAALAGGGTHITGEG